MIVFWFLFPVFLLITIRYTYALFPLPFHREDGALCPLLYFPCFQWVFPRNHLILIVQSNRPILCVCFFFKYSSQDFIVCIYQSLFNPSPMLGDIGSFQHFTITNNTAGNNFVYIYFHTIEVQLQWELPRSWISVIKRTSTHSFVKFCQILLHRGGTILNFWKK